jgi:hypothetical protein
VKAISMNCGKILLVAAALCAASLAAAAPLAVDLTALPSNPPSPQMGDHLAFRSVVRNTGAAPIAGVVAWISLVELDRGHEQPVDLEDWSARKADTRSVLGPGQAMTTEWPMRLIQPGYYRVVVSAVTRDGHALTASPFADFTVRAKPVVESARVVPVATGVPLVVGALLLLRLRRRTARSPS